MSNDMLSQEEINALLKGNEIEDKNEDSFDSNEESHENETDLDGVLSEIEIDALGEIGNISMGTAATALSTLLNKKVSITTPKVTVTTTEELADDYTMPFVAIDVRYKAGLEGSNILILNNNDAKVISDIMMGKEDFDIERDLSELDLSAVGEAMNQMIGSASTSLSEMLMKKIDIDPPITMEMSFSEEKDKIDMLNTESPIIKISFKMLIGEYVDSNIMQLLPIDFGKKMVAKLINSSSDADSVEKVESTFKDTERDLEEISKMEAEKPQEQSSSFKQSNSARHSSSADSSDYVSSNNRIEKDDMVVVKKPDFQSFNIEKTDTPIESIDLVGDIPIKIVVELGRTHKNISEILEFGQGTVIELEKLVGEALNIYANGKFIARGEVVVIDDNFGVRVTEVEHSRKKII